MVSAPFRIPRLVSILSICVCVAGAIMCTLLAATMAMSPYPLIITMCAVLACVISPVCCYDEQGTDAGDVGWLLTGILGTAAVATTVILYRHEEIDETSLYLCLASVVLSLGSVVFLYMFFSRPTYND